MSVLGSFGVMGPLLLRASNFRAMDWTYRCLPRGREIGDAPQHCCRESVLSPPLQKGGRFLGHRPEVRLHFHGYLHLRRDTTMLLPESLACPFSRRASSSQAMDWISHRLLESLILGDPSKRSRFPSPPKYASSGRACISRAFR